jgi:hypothetical protein
MTRELGDELLPCPFCEDGGCPIIWKIKRFREVACQYCKCSGPLCDTEAEAIAAWNRRPQPSASGASDLEGRLRPALVLLPIECRDTANYAEATGPQFQAMTMRPDAFLALNALPEVFDALASARAEIAGLRGVLGEAAGWFQDYATEHYRKALTAPDGREQHGREVKGKLNLERANHLRDFLANQETPDAG